MTKDKENFVFTLSTTRYRRETRLLSCFKSRVNVPGHTETRRNRRIRQRKEGTKERRSILPWESLERV